MGSEETLSDRWTHRDHSSSLILSMFQLNTVRKKKDLQVSE